MNPHPSTATSHDTADMQAMYETKYNRAGRGLYLSTALCQRRYWVAKKRSPRGNVFNIEDEFFYVIEGRFFVDLEDRIVELLPNQGFTVPRGTIHKTRAPEGRTEIVSPMRGNQLEQAAKCMVIMAKLGRKTTKYILAVVAGNTRVDFNAVKTLLGGTYVSFASPEIAEKLSGSVVGTVLPFSFSSEMELIVDPAS
jgi:Ala-tRNA(Pro) deacylase